MRRTILSFFLFVTLAACGVCAWALRPGSSPRLARRAMSHAAVSDSAARTALSRQEVLARPRAEAVTAEAATTDAVTTDAADPSDPLAELRVEISRLSTLDALEAESAHLREIQAEGSEHLVFSPEEFRELAASARGYVQELGDLVTRLRGSVPSVVDPHAYVEEEHRKARRALLRRLSLKQAMWLADNGFLGPFQGRAPAPNAPSLYAVTTGERDMFDDVGEGTALDDGSGEAEQEP